MNINFNKPVDEKTLLLFRKMEDFVWHYLDNKAEFYKIKLHYNEYDDRRSVMHYYNRCIDYEDPYKFRIFIYNFGFTSFDEIEPEEKRKEVFENKKMFIVFHELGHMIRALNNPEHAKMCQEYKHKIKKEGWRLFRFLNDEEEKWADTIAKEYMEKKLQIDLKEDAIW